MAKILIVEDDRALGELLTVLFEGMGHAASLVFNGRAALDLLEKDGHDVVFADVHMNPMSGLDLINEARKLFPRTVFVFISGDRDPELEAIGLELGALDFLHKPIRADVLKQVVKRAVNRSQQENAVALIEKAAPAGALARTLETIENDLESYFPGKSLLQIRRQVAQLMTVNRHMLIEAPDGMVNTEFLKYLHSFSPLSAGPFVNRDLIAQPVSSIAELLVSADGGTLVLQHIDTLAGELQDELASKIRETEKLRVIATTRHDPDTLMVDGKLSDGLYMRLSLCALRLPALGEIEAEFQEIMQSALYLHAWYPFGQTLPEIDPLAAAALQVYGWPENLKELWSVVNQTVLRLKAPRLEWTHLPERIRKARFPELEIYLRQEESRHIAHALRLMPEPAKAAEALGVPLVELEAYQAANGRRHLLSLSKEAGATEPPPPPPAQLLLLVAANKATRDMVVAILAGKIEVVGVYDGLAAIATVMLSPRTFTAAIVIPPLDVLDAAELGEQLLRLCPQIRIGLMGPAPAAGGEVFHAVAPPFKSGKDVRTFTAELMHGLVELSAA